MAGVTRAAVSPDRRNAWIYVPQRRVLFCPEHDYEVDLERIQRHSFTGSLGVSRGWEGVGT
jgi:hypothetical protein